MSQIWLGMLWYLITCCFEAFCSSAVNQIVCPLWWHFSLDTTSFVALCSIFVWPWGPSLHMLSTLFPFIILVLRMKPLGVHQCLRGLSWICLLAALCRSNNVYHWSPEKCQCSFSKQTTLAATRNMNASTKHTVQYIFLWFWTELVTSRGWVSCSSWNFNSENTC